jgi:chaperonin GroEL
MASPFGATSTAGLMAAPTGIVSDKKPFSASSISLVSRPRNARPQRKCSFRVKAAKELYFNKDGSATKKLQVSFSPLAHTIFNSYYMAVPGDP